MLLCYVLYVFRMLRGFAIAKPRLFYHRMFQSGDKS